MPFGKLIILYCRIKHCLNLIKKIIITNYFFFLYLHTKKYCTDVLSQLTLNALVDLGAQANPLHLQYFDISHLLHLKF